MKSYFSAVVSFSFFTLILTTSASAAVWNETPDDRGEPVEFCIRDECEMTRYVTIGSAGNWAFFDLANGYHVSTYHSELNQLTVTRAALNGEELSRDQSAVILLRDPDDKSGKVVVSPDGRFVQLTGRISEQTVAQFQAALSSHSNLVGVALNSRGGNGADALEIGNAIWDRRLSTFIPEDAQCEGACAVVFFSGYDRAADGWLSVSPLLDPQIDAAELFDGVWSLLAHKADNDLSILALYQTLEWNQSISLDRDILASFPISRDLPGDALNR